MMETPMNNPAPRQDMPEQPVYLPFKNVYTATDAAFGLTAFVLGYLFCSWVFISQKGIGAALFVFLAAAFALAYFATRGIKPAAKSWVWFAVLVFFGAVLFSSDNGTIKTLAVPALIGVYCYWVFVACSNRGGDGVDGMLFFDFLKACIVMPFSSFTAAFAAQKRPRDESRKGAGRMALFILIGIVIAIIPTGIVISLLMSADGAFSNMMGKMGGLFRDVNVTTLFRVITCCVLGIPVAMYIFGVLYANATGKNALSLRRDTCESFLRRVQFAPQALTYAAVTPICLVYVLFFISQSAYFLSAFSNLVPEGFTYAQYARNGFFELCGAAVINACVIGLSTLLTRRGEDGRRCVATRIYNIVLSVFTLALIAISMSKMIMYIDRYGLTVRRMLTSWFMLVLAFFFMLIIAKQLWERGSFMKAAVAGLIIACAALCVCDIDACIARYNVEAYRDGRTEQLDFDTLAELSDSAVPYIISLEEDDDPVISRRAHKHLQYRAERLLGDNTALRDWNLPSLRAAGMLRNNGYEATGLDLPDPDETYAFVVLRNLTDTPLTMVDMTVGGQNGEALFTTGAEMVDGGTIAYNESFGFDLTKEDVEATGLDPSELTVTITVTGETGRQWSFGPKLLYDLCPSCDASEYSLNIAQLNDDGTLVLE